jgi:small subunit ribosomal protein S2
MENTQKTESLGNSSPTNVDIKELLKAGAQFGHEKNRWNPKMKEYIFGLKNNIHIIDLEKTIVYMNEAAKFLTETASKGPILFVGTKRQARDIVKQYAVESGSYFITYRWLGGLLSNFKMIKKSLAKFIELEDEFEKGVVNRTKFEVNQMKKEWERMNRIYGGIRNMDRYPVAMVMVDCNFEKGAVIEAKAAGIPIVSMVDTNSDPTDIDYVIPANDDAMKSIKLIMAFLCEAIKKGNKGAGIKHNLKNYSEIDISRLVHLKILLK